MNNKELLAELKNKLESLKKVTAKEFDQAVQNMLNADTPEDKTFWITIQANHFGHMTAYDTVLTMIERLTDELR